MKLRRVSSGPGESVHRSTEWSMGLENSCEDHMVHRGRHRTWELESGEIKHWILKCDDDIQCSMSALYVISPDGHLWWLCWKINVENVSQLRSVSVLKVQDIGFNVKDKMFVAWKLVRYESKQNISAHD